MSRVTQEQRNEAKARLLEWLKPGDTVYTILDHVSRSGMQRRIRLVVLKDEQFLHPNYKVGLVLGRRVARGLCGDDCIVATGCGMDMGFELVYSLSQALFGDGYALNHRWL